MYCYYYADTDVRSVLTHHMLADLKRLALFNFIFWKIVKIKFAASFNKAVRELRKSLRQQLTEKDFEKLLKNDRYLKRGKRVLFSKSFELPSLRREVSPKRKPDSPDSISRVKHRNFVKSLKKKVFDQTRKKEMDLFLLQKLREPSLPESASDWDDLENGLPNLEGLLHDNNEKPVDNLGHGGRVERNRHSSVSTLLKSPAPKPKFSLFLQQMMPPETNVDEPTTETNRRKRSKSLKDARLPRVPNEWKIRRPKTRVMAMQPKYRYSPEEENYPVELIKTPTPQAKTMHSKLP